MEKETLIRVEVKDRDRLKKIAKEERRDMYVMFDIILDFWEKNHG